VTLTVWLECGEPTSSHNTSRWACHDTLPALQPWQLHELAPVLEEEPGRACPAPSSASAGLRCTPAQTSVPDHLCQRRGEERVEQQREPAAWWAPPMLRSFFQTLSLSLSSDSWCPFCSSLNFCSMRRKRWSIWALSARWARCSSRISFRISSCYLFILILIDQGEEGSATLKTHDCSCKQIESWVQI